MSCLKFRNTVQEGDTTFLAINISKKNRGFITAVRVAVMLIAALTLSVCMFGCGSDNARSNNDGDSEERAQQAASSEEQKEKTLEDYTWEELSKISEEIGNAPDEDAAIEIAKGYNLTTEDGKLDGTQTKSVTLSNGMQTPVQIVGFAHDEKTDGGKAGITFIFKDCIGERSMNSTPTNEGGWEKSEMRSYLNSEGLDLLPDDLKQELVSVNKLTDNTGRLELDNMYSISSVTKTSDKLWLFSAVELCGKEVNALYGTPEQIAIYEAQGNEYMLFRDMNVVLKGNDNDILKKNYQGSSCVWSERTPYLGSSSAFFVVGKDGHPNAVPGMPSSGVVPGFCI